MDNEELRNLYFAPNYTDMLEEDKMGISYSTDGRNEIHIKF
jgi:hypothetical protein